MPGTANGNALWNDAFLVCVEDSHIQQALALTDEEYAAIGPRVSDLARTLIAAQEALKFNPNHEDTTGTLKRAAADRRALAALHEEIRYLFNYLVPIRNREARDDS